MKHYNSLNEYLKSKYGKKVYKLSINGGMTCPNRDGTLGKNGCIFCSKGGSGEFASCAKLSIKEQLELAKKRVENKTKDNAYIAYFQPFTNTYADISYLRKIFYEAIEPEYIVGLSVATRPDCLENDKIKLLEEINKIKPVSVELGLQTIHKKTAEYIRRGYSLNVYNNAVERLHKADIEVVTHVIIGLPDESAEMMFETVRYVGKLTDGIKLQLLHIIEGTDIAEEYSEGTFKVLTMEKYTDIICECIEILPENVIIHRITGDGDKRSLIAPLWSGDKKRVLNYMNNEFKRRNIIQGSKSETRAE
ncbi:MAG: TIGR01212 family radical SAM protein [Ruminococcus sp.]|nr:TIGR01212 family radical SAM protein [Ruminococcus sp.]